MPHRSFQIFPARWLGASHYYGGVLSTLTLTMAISVKVNLYSQGDSNQQKSETTILVTVVEGVHNRQV